MEPGGQHARVSATPAAREAVIRLRAAQGPIALSVAVNRGKDKDVMWRQASVGNPVTR